MKCFILLAINIPHSIPLVQEVKTFVVKSNILFSITLINITWNTMLLTINITKKNHTDLFVMVVNIALTETSTVIHINSVVRNI